MHFRQARLDLPFQLCRAVMGFCQAQIGINFQIQMDVHPAVHLIGADLVYQEIPAMRDGTNFCHQIP